MVRPRRRILSDFEPEQLDLSVSTRPEVNERLHSRLRDVCDEDRVRVGRDRQRDRGAIGFVRAPAEWIATEHAWQSRAVMRVSDPEFGPI
jgi:hypothetical protein